MTEIPEDILIKAREVTNKLHCFMPEGDEIVAMAILAERERCAKVADEQAADWLQGILKATESFGLHYGSGRRDGAIVIAKAIRGED